MATSQSYLLAATMLNRALQDPNWTAAKEQRSVSAYYRLGPAVVFDIDETILSNALNQGQIVRDDTEFTPELWSDWIATRRATAIPGAKEYIDQLRRRGIKVFYVTNRDHKHDEDTAANLIVEGFPLEPDRSNLLSKGKEPNWGSNKTTRRAYMAERDRIVQLVGDDDFDDATPIAGSPIVTPESQLKSAEENRSYWGTKWIVVPNPMYGHSLDALYGFDHSLCRAKKLEKKRDAVKGFR